MIIETTMRIHGLKILLEVPVSTHKGDIHRAESEAEFAARSLAYLIQSSGGSGMQVATTLTGTLIETNS